MCQLFTWMLWIRTWVLPCALLMEYLPDPNFPSFLLLGRQRAVLYLLSLAGKHSQKLLSPQFTEEASWLWKHQRQLNLDLGVEET